MLKKDKNGFLQVIEQNGFQPSMFKRYEKDDVDGHPGFILQLANSPMYFLARTNQEDYRAHDIRYIKFAPKYPKSEYHPESGWMEINLVFGAFAEWLKYDVMQYLEEIEVPDLWEQVEGQALLNFDPLQDRNQGNFTKPEKEKVLACIERFKELIHEQYSPSEEKLEIIEDRLDYLAESLNRLNKVDWQGIAISTVISISIALSLDTENGKELFGLFRKAFSLTLELFQ